MDQGSLSIKQKSIVKAIGVGLGMACVAPMYAFAADTASPSTMQTSESKPQETANANTPATDSAAQKSVDKSAEEKATLGTIEVTGIVGSLDRALNLKRTNTTIVDAISAEDVGKFPDTNLAESLQRITGVQMTRDSNGEGQYVSVRGLPTDFTLATYNGMTMPTVDLANGGANGEQNRTFNYNVISPDFLSSLEVYKGSRADLDEGGIGATVDLRTVTPFGIGKEKFLLSAKEQGSPGKTGNRNYPDITALYSNIFADGTFGLTVGFDWNKRYFANTVADGDYGSYATINSIDGKQGPFYYMQAPTYGKSYSKVDTKTGFLSAQWRPTDSTTVTLDTLYTKKKLNSTTIEMGVVPFQHWDTPDYPIKNSDGSITSSGPVTFTADKNNVITSINSPDAWFIFIEPITRQSTNNKNINLNFDTQIDNWEFSETIQFNGTHDDYFWWRPQLGISSSLYAPPNYPNMYGGYSFHGGNPVPSISASSNINLADPNAWGNDKLINYDQYGADRLRTFKADVTRNFDDGFITSIKFGAKISQQIRRLNSYHYNFDNNYGDAQNGNNLGYLAPMQSAVTPSPLTNGLPSPMFYINPNLWLNQYFGGSMEAMRASPLGQNWGSTIWSQTERTRDAYVMTNFKFESPLPISGNIGVRYINYPEKFTTSFYDINSIQIQCYTDKCAQPQWTHAPETQFGFRGGMHQFLPSLNLTANLTDTMDLRFAASKTISLATLGSQIPAPNVDITQLHITMGNPSLKPFTSYNYDLSYEWYFLPTSVFSVALYDKQIHNFIHQGDYQRAINGYTWTIYTPFNVNNAYVRGVEADYKQFFSFLPSFWSGFGVEMNVTYSKGQQSAAPEYGVPFATDFSGLSKNTYNASVFYEKYGFSGVITFNRRSRYLVSTAGDMNGSGAQDTYVQGRNQVDMHLAYKINQNLSVFADVQNLDNSSINRTIQFVANPSAIYPSAYTLNERRVAVGGTLTF